MNDRLRLRRSMLGYSAPVVVIVLLLIAKLVSVGMAGNAAVSNFSGADAKALSGNVDTLQMLNIIEPEKAHYAAGTLAVLQGRLDDADREFALALDGSGNDESCEARVNLELVRESRGDNAAAIFEAQTAVDHYLSARQLVAQAPVGCFAGNADADPERRTVRADALARLDAKIAAVAAPPPPPPPAAPPVSVPAAPTPGSESPADQEKLLDPGQGDPLDRLRQILQDGA
jgi:hypothetical protein